MPSPALNTAGPKWSKKMNGPTMRERADGSARCTWKPPRSTERGTMTWAMASTARASPKAGSLAGKKLMRHHPPAAARGQWRSALGLIALRDQIRDEARLSESGNMDFGCPILGRETAGLAVALGDGLHRM